MSLYGNYMELRDVTPEKLTWAQEEIRQKAIKFLEEMNQPVEKMRDVEIITKATVAWKVEI